MVLQQICLTWLLLLGAAQFCEGCFHSTAASPFLAGSLPHTDTPQKLLSALLFAPQVSGQTQVAEHRPSADRKCIIYTDLLQKEGWTAISFSPSLNEI